jgi:hypothetical protein
MRTGEIFLPPGVEARLYDALGYRPHRLPTDAAMKIEALLQVRDDATESELDGIDEAIEAVVLREAARLWSTAAALA